MDGHWDDILQKLDSLERDLARVGDLMTCVSSEIEMTWNALEQARADLNKTRKQAATLKALSPYRRYAGAGQFARQLGPVVGMEKPANRDGRWFIRNYLPSGSLIKCPWPKAGAASSNSLGDGRR
jgi:hypothetical protein